MHWLELSVNSIKSNKILFDNLNKPTSIQVSHLPCKLGQDPIYHLKTNATKYFLHWNMFLIWQEFCLKHTLFIFDLIWWCHYVQLFTISYEGLDGGSGIHYSLKIEPIFHLIKILGYSLK